MTKKISDLNDYRKKKNPPSLDDIARIAALHYFDLTRRADVEEPIALASGKTYTGGSFVPVTQAEIKADEEIDNQLSADHADAYPV